MTIMRRASYCLLGLMFACASAGAQMYKWTDENGNIHFSDKPQPNAQKLEIKTPQSSGIGTSRQQRRSQQELLKDLQYSRQQREQAAAQDAQQRERQQQRCQRLRNRLRNYEDVDYVFYRDGQGKKIRLSREQKKQEERKLRRQIEENC